MYEPTWVYIYMHGPKVRLDVVDKKFKTLSKTLWQNGLERIFRLNAGSYELIFRREVRKYAKRYMMS